VASAKRSDRWDHSWMADEANELRQFMRECLMRFDRLVEYNGRRIDGEAAA
jgi:hypothetical protein